jgi:hypothetical protein
MIHIQKLATPPVLEHSCVTVIFDGRKIQLNCSLVNPWFLSLYVTLGLSELCITVWFKLQPRTPSTTFRSCSSFWRRTMDLLSRGTYGVAFCRRRAVCAGEVLIRLRHNNNLLVHSVLSTPKWCFYSRTSTHQPTGYHIGHELVAPALPPTRGSNRALVQSIPLHDTTPRTTEVIPLLDWLRSSCWS